ncbi:MAG TPA: hypothetical protein VK939_03090 [Longimicrobiales bacterium]|nr:hypothetical protein [Longimicrobiales bacterium]
MRRGIVAAAMVALLVAACKPYIPDLPPSMIPEPAAADVETVVFLVGDAGHAIEERYPVMSVLRGDVEAWSRQLRGDTSVVVLYLGDIVYPDGMSAADEAGYARDSLVVQAQANVVAGPAARERGWAFFMAGNHDWGNARNTEGVARLQELERFLDRRRANGLRVRLLPEAGEPGPAVLDIGTRLTILLYDTAWWLLASDAARKARMFSQTEDALRRSRGRVVLFAAHHPWRSASPHGGNVGLWKAFGLRYLLNRSGAILQDLNSIPYRELTRSLERSFRVYPPLVFAGGHDHSLQVIQTEGEAEPRFAIVSGSASKVSDVGHIAGMRYRLAAPGYGKLYIRRDGHVDFIMVAAPDKDQLSCDGTGDALRECMTRAMASFRPRFGMRLQ